MFHLDDEDRLALATAEFTTLLGTTPEALAGRPVESLVSETDREPLHEAIAAVRDGERVTRRCSLTFTGGDAPVPATVEFAAVGGTVVGSVCRTVEPGDRFEHLFELIQDAVVAFEMVDGVPVVRAVNPAFVDTFGYDRAAIVGEPLNDYIVPDGRVEEAVDYDQRTAAGEINYAIVTRETVDGRREFIYRGIPYDSADGRRYGFAIYTDVTDSRRQQRRLRVLHRVLRHNLRNDLSVVFGMGEYVRSNALSEPVSDAASRALDAAERLAAVSEKSRNVENALDGSPERSVDAAALARSIADGYGADAAVETDLPETLPVAGGTAVYDALDNLVENAVEHTPTGTPVRVTADRADGDAYLRVADRGPGIPAVERAVVFEDENITNLQHGSGLGIWLARWVAEAAGGDIAYDRADGWTTVTLRLLLSDDDDVLVPTEPSGAAAESTEE
ncbi:PAS domain-containing sensor histidine kinase [Haloarcula salina]|uniref:histidine kinase n=1 Tax=Haloarcula salina TaxID=1429914 RepID=A0AA41G0N6_9EURY|nr:ATP-binding protein [Haloarcula salina]MBV0902240.1 PAS domain S-box protein [Haloarcula salina]